MGDEKVSKDSTKNESNKDELLDLQKPCHNIVDRSFLEFIVPSILAIAGHCQDILCERDTDTFFLTCLAPGVASHLLFLEISGKWMKGAYLAPKMTDGIL